MSTIDTPSSPTANQLRELADLIDRHTVVDGIHPTAISALELYGDSRNPLSPAGRRTR